MNIAVFMLLLLSKARRIVRLPAGKHARFSTEYVLRNGWMFYLGIAGSVLLFIISAFHFYWLFGGTVGTDRYIHPDKDGNRIAISKAMMLATSLVFAIAAIIPLVALGIINAPLPYNVINVCLIFGIAIMSIRGIGGLIWSLLQKKPRDIFHRWNIGLYTLLCIFLAISYFASYTIFNA